MTGGTNNAKPLAEDGWITHCERGGSYAASQAKRVSPEFNFISSAMSFNIKKLIEQVKQRPPLWDRQHSGYFNKKLVAKLWSEIAMLQGVDRKYFFKKKSLVFFA